MRMLAAILAVSTLCAAQRTLAKEAIFSDDVYYVYQEENSCALYADYPNKSMLRLAYKGSTSTVYFTLYSSQFDLMDVKTKPFPITLATNDDPKSHLGFMGFIVSNGERKGLNTSGGVEILDYLQGARQLHIYGRDGLEITRFGIPSIDVALKRLKTCGDKK